MLARTFSCAVVGLDGVIVEVEVDYSNGLPGMTIVGLPDAAVQESRERVQTAVKNAGLHFPRHRIVVNLAPASVRKEGPSYDLPIAVGILGVIMERVMLRRLYSLDHLYGLLLTFGLGLIIQGLFRNRFGSSGLPYAIPSQLTGGRNLGSMILPNYRAWVIVFSLVICLATWFVIERTKLGSYLRAATENPALVQAFGSLARFVLGLMPSSYQTSASQWMERTLDDSAHRRLTISQGLLAADAILVLFRNVASGLVVYPKMIEARLAQELPFMAAEVLLMEAVKRGGDRQDLHERFRVTALEAGRRIKAEGRPNELLKLLAADPAWAMTEAELAALLDARRFTGRAGDQVRQFLAGPVAAALKDHAPAAEAAVRVPGGPQPRDEGFPHLGHGPVIGRSGRVLWRTFGRPGTTSGRVGAPFGRPRVELTEGAEGRTTLVEVPVALVDEGALEAELGVELAARTEPEVGRTYEGPVKSTTAFGALAFGIGTSEVEHVLATQCLLQKKPKTYEVRVDGTLAPGVSAKDIILALIAKIGVGGGTGHVFEYTGSAIRGLHHAQKLICAWARDRGIKRLRRTWRYGQRDAPIRGTHREVPG